MKWKIGELAKIAGISVRTLHHYEAIQLLLPASRLDNGYRLYDEKSLHRLMQIICLSKIGMSLQEVKDALQTYPKGIVNHLQQHLDSLTKEVEAITLLQNRLQGIMTKISNNEQPQWIDWAIDPSLVKHLYEKNDIKKDNIMTIDIKPSTKADYPTLLEIWSRAVLATHDFLQPEDYAEIKTQLIPHYFPAVTLYQAVDATTEQVLGFVGVLEGCVEMLFIDANARGKGVGRKLLDFAVENLNATHLDVNEQNPQAVGFYLHYGCVQTKRSELDSTGKPYPILTLRLPERPSSY